MKRIITVAVAALTLGAAIGVYAASRFSDVPDDHPRRVDIETVAGWGGYSGYEDGTFRPNRRITADQMATVLGRIFDDGMTRAEFASFMVGGKNRKDNPPAPSTTTPAPSTTTTSAAAYNDKGCADFYAELVDDSTSDYDFNPDKYSADRDVEAGEYGRNRWGEFDIGGTDVIAVYEWYKRIHTSTVFMCQGRAKLDNGRSLPIVIRWIIDQDGDSFSNYVFPSGMVPTCSVAKTNGWDDLTYNFSFLYREARDADDDRIMCEGVLSRHKSVLIGESLL